MNQGKSIKKEKAVRKRTTRALTIGNAKQASGKSALAIVPAHKIKTRKAYNNTIAQIEQLLENGNGIIRKQDMPHYERLARAAQAYEKTLYTIDAPKTLEGLLEWKMYELKLKQRDLAIKLKVSDAKLSLVMSGKQKPDATLLKSIHDRLGIDGNVLLSVIR